MTPQQRDVSHPAGLTRGAVAGDEELLPLEVRALAHRMFKAEEAELAGQCGGQGLHLRIVGVEDGDIGGSLVGKNLLLGGPIPLHAAVTIEVVGGKVEEERDVRTA